MYLFAESQDFDSIPPFRMGPDLIAEVSATVAVIWAAASTTEAGGDFSDLICPDGKTAVPEGTAAPAAAAIA